MDLYVGDAHLNLTLPGVYGRCVPHRPGDLGAALTSGTVGRTWSVNQLAYVYAFTDGNFGKSAAVSVGLLLVAIVGALLVIFRTDFYRID